MLTKLNFRFSGFHGSEGQCHITVASSGEGEKPIIVCSQYRGYYGTSITNAVEIIAEELFTLAASGDVKGISVGSTVPLIREWNSDINAVDRILLHLNPGKYEKRFSRTKLDVAKLFSKFVWIEHYPEDWFPSSLAEKIAVIVEMTDACRPVWRGNVDSEWLANESGFRLEDVLPSDAELDLSSVRPDAELPLRPHVTISHQAGYHSLHWTKELIELLPGMIASKVADSGKANLDDVGEDILQREIEKFLSRRMPARELVAAQHSITKELGLRAAGRDKACDVAIFSPSFEKRKLHAVIEIKRTSSKRSELAAKVKEDIARLLLLSQWNKCACYLLVCGDPELIDKCATSLSEYLCKSIDQRLQFTVDGDKFPEEYRYLINQLQIQSGASLYQGSGFSGKYEVSLWQISVNAKTLSNHSPYEFCVIPAKNRSKRRCHLAAMTGVTDTPNALLSGACGLGTLAAASESSVQASVAANCYMTFR